MTEDAHTLVATIGTLDLKPTTTEFTLDEGWSPYGQATIECPIPSDLDAIDPRLKLRLDLRAEQAFGVGPSTADYTALHGGSIATWNTAHGGSIPSINAAHFQGFNDFGLRDSTTRTASLLLRSRKIDREARTVTLKFATDEALLQAYALVATAVFEPASTSVRQLVKYVLSLIGAFLETGTDDGVIAASSSRWLPGVYAWDYLTPLLQAAQLRLYCDEMRRWYLVTDKTIVPGQLTLVDTTNITGADDEIDLDGEWYDAVVVTYTWTDALGATQQAWDTAAQPNFSKVFAIEYNLPYPGAGAAGRILSRALGLGRTQDVRAISDYTATPSQAVTLSITGDDTQVGYVASVAWKWPDAEMRVKSRGLVEAPASAWVLDPAGVSWAALAAGIKWTDDI